MSSNKWSTQSIWESHKIEVAWTYNSVVKKGNSVYGFLKRNLRNCPAAVKSYCYQMYLWPVLEYASIVAMVTIVSQILRWSARFVRRDRYASVTNMMSLLGWPTLKSRRTNAKLIMLYKIINNIVDVDLDGNLLMSASSYHTPYTLSSDSAILKSRCI